MVGADFSTSTRSADATTRIAALEVALAERDTRIAELLRERDELRAAYDRLWLEVELMRRRIFIAKAERVDTTQLELEFKDKLAALDKLAGTLGIGPASDATDGKNGGSRPKPKGRRDLRQIKMPEERVEIPTRRSRPSSHKARPSASASRSRPRSPGSAAVRGA